MKIKLTKTQQCILKAMRDGIYGDFGDGMVITAPNGIMFQPVECEHINEDDIAQLQIRQMREGTR